MKSKKTPTDRSGDSFSDKSVTLAFLLFFSQVLEAIAAARGEDIEELAATVYENTKRVFF